MFGGKIFRKFLSVFLILGITLPGIFVSFYEVKASGVWDFFTSGDDGDLGFDGGVLVLVENGLLDDEGKMREALTVYEQNLGESLNVSVTEIFVEKTFSVKEMAEGISSLYFSAKDSGERRLEGLVLVGDLPLPVVEKRGYLWPTIFPYTDFEKPSYVWDLEKERFVFDVKARGDGVPELWHGVIRSDAETLNLQRAEILEYFAKNDQVHRGDITFGKRFFYGDFNAQYQSAIVGALGGYLLRQKYLEDLVYGRFIRKFLAVIQGEKKSFGAKYEDLTSFEVPSDVLPDVQVSDIVKTFLPEYLDIYIDWVKGVEKKVVGVGRWEREDIDTLPGLVTRKDAMSSVILRNFNDALEEKFVEVLRQQNVAAKIGVTKNQWVYEYDEEGGIARQWLEPLYWNGVKRDGMRVEDCSLFRGNGDGAFAQMVEANRTMDPETTDCNYFAEPLSSRNGDKYEGCCGVHVTFDASRGEFGYNYCKSGSEWISGESFLPYHMGAEENIFSYRGTRPKLGPIGASGCKGILAPNELEEWNLEEGGFRLDSLMLHDLPTDEVLALQYEEGLGMALPVDDSRAVSFYDHGIAARHDGEDPDRFFHVVPFFNVFDQKGLWGDLYDAVGVGDDLVHEGAVDIFRAKLREILTVKAQKINTIVRTGNEFSRKQLAADQGKNWPIEVFSVPEAPVGGSVEGGCTYSKNLTHVDRWTQKLRWTESCDYQLMSAGSLDEESGVSSEPEALDSVTSERAIERFYTEGNEISEDFFVEVLDADMGIELLSDKNSSGLLFDYEEGDQRFVKKLLDALTWWHLSIDEKNRRAMEVVLGEQEKFQSFFGTAGFDGYEMVVLKGEGNARDGIVMRFLPELLELEAGDQTDVINFLQAENEAEEFVEENRNIPGDFLGMSVMGMLLPNVWDFAKNKLGTFSVSTPFPYKKSTEKENSARMILGTYGEYFEKPQDQKKEDLVMPDGNEKPDGLRILHALEDGEFREISEILVPEDFGQMEDFRVQMMSGDEILREDSLSNVKVSVRPKAAEKFVKVSPETNRVESGVVNFSIDFEALDQRRDFALIFTSESVSKKLPVKVASHRVMVMSDTDEISADDVNQGILMEVGLFDGKGKVVRDREVGKLLHLESDDGRFEPTSVRLNDKNSPATVQFFPKEDAKKAVVYVRDPSRKIPDASRVVVVNPGKPGAMKTDHSSAALVAGTMVMIGTSLSDAYGNDIPHYDQRLEILPAKGLEIVGAEEMDIDPEKEGIQMQTYDGGNDFFVRLKEGATEARVEIFSDQLDEGRLLNFYVPENPFLEGRMLLNEAVAGENKTGKVLVLARDRVLENGTVVEKKIPGKILVQVRAEPSGILEVPEFVWIEEDGPGVVEFTSLNTAGEVKIILSTVGMEDFVGEFEVLADEARKLNITPKNFAVDKPFFLKNGGGNRGELAVEVVDRFGNRATSFSKKVLLKVSGGGDALGMDENLEVDIRRGLGVVDFDFSGGEIQFKNSGDFAIWQDGHEGLSFVGDSGLMRIWGGDEDLIPGTVEILLSDSLSAGDIREDLYPESLVTFALGFGAGNMRYGQNFGSSFLMSGNTQVVVTESAPQKSVLQLGGVDASGNLLGNMVGEIREGESYQIDLKSTEDFMKPLVRVRVPFTETLPVKLDSDITSKGIYISSDEEGPEILSVEDRLLLVGGVPGILFSEKNGFQIFSGDLDLRRGKENIANIFNWEIWKRGLKIGEISWVDVRRDFVWLESSRVKRKTAADDEILFWSLVSGVEGRSALTGAGTNDRKGLIFYDFLREAPDRVLLGNRYGSVEDAVEREGGLFEDDFRPISLMASGNSVGESLRVKASDALLVFGDPSLKLAASGAGDGVLDEVLGLGDEHLENDLGNLGEVIWEGGDRNISGIFSGDFLAENDLMVWLGDGDLVRLKYLNGKWYEDRVVWEGGFGVREILNFDFGGDGDQDFLVLDFVGNLSVLENQEGKFVSKKLALPLDKKVENFRLGNFNSDDFLDLVFADQDHQLWLSYGRDTGFLEPVFVDEVLPIFGRIDESGDDDNLGILDEMMVAYEGSDHKRIGREFLLGGEAYNFWNAEDVFMNTKLILKSSREDEKIARGDVVKGRLEFESVQDVNEVKFWLPLFESMELVKDSLKCLGCGADISLLDVSGMTGNIYEIKSLPKQKKLALEFDLQVTDLGALDFLVVDKNSDGLDDIVVIRSNEEGEQILQVYYTDKVAGVSSSFETPGLDVSTVGSSGDPESKEKVLKTLVGIGVVAKGIEFLSGRETFFTEKKLESVGNVSTEVVASNDGINTAATERESGFNSGVAPQTTGIKNPQNSAEEDSALTKMREGRLMERTGLEAAKPEASHPASWGGVHNQPRGNAPLAPGYETIYTPPITSPGGIGPGTKSLSFAFPTTGPKCRPVVSSYPTLKPGYQSSACQTSVIRKYTIPVEPYGTAQVLCWNKFDNHFPLTSDFEGKANCILTNRGGLQKPGLNPVNQVNADSLLARAREVDAMGEGMVMVVDENDASGMDIGVFKPKVRSVKNFQIPGVDVASRWMQLQGREVLRNTNNALSSLAMPQVSMAPNAKPMENTTIGSGGVMEQVYAALAQQPFFNVQMEKVTLPFLEMSDSEMTYEREAYQVWQKREREKLNRFLSQEECRGALQSSCQNLEEKVRAYFQKTDRNREQMRSYLDASVKLQAYEEKLTALLKTIIEQSQLMADFQQAWFYEIQQDVQDWDKTEQLNARLQHTWQRSVMAPFYGYDMVHRDVVDRGTLLEWLFRDYFGAGGTFGMDNHSIRGNVSYMGSEWKYDKTKPEKTTALPRIPDMNLDLSNATTAVDVKLPIPDLQPLDQQLFHYNDVRYPVMNQESLDSFVAPPVPTLPLMPDFNFFAGDTLDDLELPGLPQLPPAPKFPEVYAEIPGMVSVAQENFTLFKALHLGYAVVPEWYVRPFVEQVFNRSTLGDIDLVTSGRVHRANDSGSSNIPKSTRDHLTPNENFSQPQTSNNREILSSTSEKMEAAEKDSRDFMERSYQQKHCEFEDVSRCGIGASDNEYYAWNELLEILEDGFQHLVPRSERVAEIRREFLAESDRLREGGLDDFYGKKLERMFAVEREQYEGVLSSLSEKKPPISPFEKGDLYVSSALEGLVDLRKVRLVSEEILPWDFYEKLVDPTKKIVEVFASVSEEDAIVFEPSVSGLFRIDADGNIVRVTDFSLGGNNLVLARDVDGDSREEILFTDNNTIYLKDGNGRPAKKDWETNQVSAGEFFGFSEIVSALEIEGGSRGVSLEFEPSEKVDKYLVEVYEERNEEVILEEKFVLNGNGKVRKFFALPEGSYVMDLSGFWGAKKIGDRTNLRFSVQKAIDLVPPRIRVKGSFEQFLLPGDPIILDISQTVEDDIQTVWWDLDLSQDSDQDGDPENDFDLPTRDGTKNYEEFLKISLASLEVGDDLRVKVSVMDTNGNISSEIISLKTLEPYVTLDLLSAEKGAVGGRVDQEGQLVQVYRLRDNVFAKVREVLDGGNDGYFELDDLGRDGMYEVREKNTDQSVLQVLSSGRVLVKDDRFGVVMEGATADHAMRFRLRDKRNRTIGYIDLSDKDLRKNFGRNHFEKARAWEKFVKNNASGVGVFDRFEGDRFEWKYQNVCRDRLVVSCADYPESFALVDTSLGGSETIGILDGYGDFYPTTGRVTLRVERANHLNDRLVFQVWVDGDAVAMFVQ